MASSTWGRRSRTRCLLFRCRRAMVPQSQPMPALVHHGFPVDGSVAEVQDGGAWIGRIRERGPSGCIARRLRRTTTGNARSRRANRLRTKEHAMFIQVITGKTSDPTCSPRARRDVEASSTRRERLPRNDERVAPTKAPHRGGAVRLAGVGAGNSDRPEQGAVVGRDEKLVDRVEFKDSTDIVTMLGGGSDDAGSVQAMRGGSTDPGSPPSLRGDIAKMEKVSSAARPDVIGETIAVHDDGTYTDVVYFTSQAEARANETKELPAEAQAMFEALMSAIAVDEHLDLADPVLVTDLIQKVLAPWDGAAGGSRPSSAWSRYPLRALRDREVCRPHEGGGRLRELWRPAARPRGVVWGTIEVVGGVLLVAGLLTRLAAVALAVDLVVAISTAGVMEGGASTSAWPTLLVADAVPALGGRGHVLARPQVGGSRAASARTVRRTVVLVTVRFHGVLALRPGRAARPRRRRRRVAGDLPGHGADRRRVHGSCTAMPTPSYEYSMASTDDVVLLGSLVRRRGDRRTPARTRASGTSCTSAPWHSTRTRRARTWPPRKPKRFGLSHHGRPDFSAMIVRGTDGMATVTSDGVAAAPVPGLRSRHASMGIGQHRAAADDHARGSLLATSCGARAVHICRVRRRHGPAPGSATPVATRCTEQVEWPTSHSPFASWPDLVADLLVDLAR